MDASTSIPRIIGRLNPTEERSAEPPCLFVFVFFGFDVEDVNAGGFLISFGNIILLML